MQAEIRINLLGRRMARWAGVGVFMMPVVPTVINWAKEGFVLGAKFPRRDKELGHRAETGGTIAQVLGHSARFGGK